MGATEYQGLISLEVEYVYCALHINFTKTDPSRQETFMKPEDRQYSKLAGQAPVRPPPAGYDEEGPVMTCLHLLH